MRHLVKWANVILGYYIVFHGVDQLFCRPTSSTTVHIDRSTATSQPLPRHPSRVPYRWSTPLIHVHLINSCGYRLVLWGGEGVSPLHTVVISPAMRTSHHSDRPVIRSVPAKLLVFCDHLANYHLPHRVLLHNAYGKSPHLRKSAQIKLNNNSIMVIIFII